MELKIDLSEKLTAEAIRDSLQKTIMVGAVSHILKELTPERMEVFVQALLDKAFEGFRSWEISQEISKAAEPMIRASVNTPEVQARIAEAVKAGIDKAIAELPDHVAQDVTSAAIRGIKDRR